MRSSDTWWQRVDARRPVSGRPVLEASLVGRGVGGAEGPRKGMATQAVPALAGLERGRAEGDPRTTGARAGVGAKDFAHSFWSEVAPARQAGSRSQFKHAVETVVAEAWRAMACGRDPTWLPPGVVGSTERAPLLRGVCVHLLCRSPPRQHLPRAGSGDPNEEPC